jgi:hypothetical protein
LLIVLAVNVARVEDATGLAARCGIVVALVGDAVSANQRKRDRVVATTAFVSCVSKGSISP